MIKSALSFLLVILAESMALKVITVFIKWHLLPMLIFSVLPDLYENQVLIVLDEINAMPVEYQMDIKLQWGSDVVSITSVYFPYFFRSVNVIVIRS